MKYSIICIALLIVLVACQQTIIPGTFQDQTSFDPEELDSSQFASVDELTQFISNAQPNFPVRRFGDAVALDVAVAESAPTAAGTDFSETNNQVQGVDEGDIIKTDGAYIYTVSDFTLFIIEAGQDAEIVSTYVFDQRPSQLFIHDDTLVVMGVDATHTIASSYQRTFVTIFDMSDRTDPVLTKEFSFEGYLQQSRMIDEHMYLVTQSYPSDVYPMPFIIEDGVERRSALSDIIRFPYPYESVQYTHVHAVDVADFSSESLSLLLEGSSTVYMSEDNLYLAYTKWINEYSIRQKVFKEVVTPLVDVSTAQLIERIKTTDNDILTQSEKDQKILRLLEGYLYEIESEQREHIEEEVDKKTKATMQSYKYREFTLLHRIQVDDLNIAVAAEGSVPGALNNQFSMDEYDDVLRVATTVNRQWTGNEMIESQNAIFTLDDDLEQLDQIIGIAEGESIFSTRFVADKLYMVTFRQVDPFFVFDLSDPSNIEELGELKIPGFSRYLHPYDEHTIIGLGRDATSDGQQRGLKISLFDVSDVSDPKEVAQYISKERYANSIAEWEHKAFLFSKEKNLLVIPAYSWDWQGDSGYNGALVFHIEPDEIELRGLVDHSSGTRYGNAVERSLYIDDILYTKSRTLLRLHEIEDLSSVKNLSLNTKGDLVIY